MWPLFLFLAVVLYLAWAKRVEGMSPSEMNEEHTGKIIKLDKQLNAFGLNKAVVDELESKVDKNVENTSALQANLGQNNPNGKPNAYPP